MQCGRLGRRLAATCVVTATLLTGCGVTGCSSSSSKPAVCSDIDNLKASVQSLKDTNISANGLSAISADLTKIKQQLQTLENDAKNQYATQINNLSNALDGLSSNLDAAKANPSAGTLSTLATSAGAVITAGQNLVTAVSNTC